jgi:tetratricopeptide (TPR) repeat protein
VFGTAGDLMLGDSRREEAIAAFVEWALSLLRPDGATHDVRIAPQDWLDRTSWRPYLALLCHYDYLRVPEFSERYRRHPQESAADNLCGLWTVGPSTFYRYLDKAKRTLARQLAQPLSAEAKLSLRRTLAHALRARLQARDIADPREWHAKQARHAAMTRDPCSALWHHHCAADAAGFISALQRFRVELAGDSESDLLIEAFAGAELPARELFDLRLAQAAVLRSRGAEARAGQVYEEALRIATAAGDRLMLGKVYGALGKFHESRDTDKALACFDDSADFLRRAAASVGPNDAAPDAEVVNEYAAALQRLAWVHVVRNDPRSRTVLETATELRRAHAIRDETAALLDQTWGEYWRRTGDCAKAIEFQHRVLNVFERLGDTRQILSTYNNLSLIYIEAKDFERAIEYGNKVGLIAERSPVDAYVTASALLNLGVAWFWLGTYSRAIRHYEGGLEQALRANLPVIANRARYNLAEAHYKRFQIEHDPADEAAGDRHIALVVKADPSERDGWSMAAAPRLKVDVLGDNPGMVHERLLPEEAAAHGEEMAAIHRQRDVLAIPGDPRLHVGARLAIAHAYLAISTKEREEALALIRKHDLGNEFDAQIDALQITFSRELTREKVLAAQWKRQSYGVLGDERAHTVLQQVLQSGSINKSGYADLCQVGLATASKHLGTLVERGLLVQTGKGPSTRYVLP